MIAAGLVPLEVFFLTIGIVLALYRFVSRDDLPMKVRLESLGRKTPPRGSAALRQAVTPLLVQLGRALIPASQAVRKRLQARARHAGFYGRQAMVVFLGIKVAAFCLTVGIGVALIALRIVPVALGAGMTAIVALLAILVPEIWLERRKQQRQAHIRQVLPDVIDVLMICLEGGLSLPASIQRVVGEFRSLRTPLGVELDIVQREVQLGQSVGESLRRMGERTDVEEVDSFAMTLEQAEQLGSSLVKPLRNQVEALRLKRLQQAEEAARKAATKILFPTLLLIFPCIFVILLGPSVYQILDMLKQL